MVVIIDYVFDVLVAWQPVGHCDVDNMLQLDIVMSIICYCRHPAIKWELLKKKSSFFLRYWSSGYALGALCHFGFEHDARLCVR